MKLTNDQKMVMLAYVLHVIGPFGIWLSGVIGCVINYLQRETVSEPWRSHHQWMITTFWVGLVGSTLGVLLTVIFIGWPILVGVMLWWTYRMVRGILRLLERRPPAF